MKTTIIVLQTSPGGRSMARRALAELGLWECQDYRILGDLEALMVNLESELDSDKRQLFITGTFHGNENGVPEMVKWARNINSHLVCMSFALDPIEAEFDHVISKNTGAGAVPNFVEAVKGFLQGTINRTNP